MVEDPLSGLQLHAVPLAVIEGEGDDVEALVLGDAETGGGIQSTAHEYDCAFAHAAHLQFMGVL